MLLLPNILLSIKMCICVYIVFVLTVEACETEHANLLCDVVPRPWCPQGLELSFQLSPHQQDPVSHGLHIVLPGGKEKENGISTSEHITFMTATLHAFHG